jgi:hypothetical protein
MGGWMALSPGSGPGMYQSIQFKVLKFTRICDINSAVISCVPRIPRVAAAEADRPGAQRSGSFWSLCCGHRALPCDV